MEKCFQATTEVSAPPEIGWNVLTDFDQYPEWNPLLRSVKGKAAKGAPLQLHVANSLGSDNTTRLPAKVRVCDPHRELAWGGGVRRLLDVHHYFRLEPAENGFRFVHGEDFRGLLVPLVWPLLGKRVRQDNYEALNEAFRVRCETIAGKIKPPAAASS